MVRLYPAEPAVDAGAMLRLHVATRLNSYCIRIERWDDAVRTVAIAGPFRGVDAPPGAAAIPWDWPAIEIPLARDLQSGAYIARALVEPDGGVRAPRERTPDARWGTALFVVRDRSAARVLVNLPLFTYHAYNVADVDGTRGEGEGACLYSGERAVTLMRPGGGTGGHPWDEVNADVYDRASPRQTFAHWDRHALAWFARERIPVDVCTDLDLHRGDVPLERYDLLCSFGHDEYWTREKRAAVERFLDDGGNVAFFGGNTCWFRVRYDAATASIARDGRWSDDQPEDALTGLSFRAGGGKWIGPRPPTGYRIVDDDAVLRAAGLRVGDVLGAAHRLIGYECDGVDLRNAPDGLRILGRVPLEGWNVEDGSGEIAPGGHAAMATFRCREGVVFNAGTADWARCLRDDPQVAALTRAVVGALTTGTRRSRPVPERSFRGS
ncbi:MAG TPA: N,N-dimethylformamidase beta subunit family domain-containing protein [Candidatus Elarobacter sp.]|jgi:hypothetical protein